MSRFILLVVLLIALLPACGCFLITDQRHNRGHWEIVRNDLRIIHEDIDFLLSLDAPSYLEIVGR